MKNSAKLYLVPSFLGENLAENVFPELNKKIIESINDFVVENEKSARRFIKIICPEKKQNELRIQILDKKTSHSEIPDLMKPLKEGKSVGIISEAGMPSIADPGAKLVKMAHANGFQVIPLVGPSSIFLALAASGFNGQLFTFNGYLPIDKNERKKAIKELERKSQHTGSAEIFMETPYRNNALLEDLKLVLQSQTQLCVACDITLATEFIFSSTVKNWQNKKVDLHKRPAIFIIQG